MQILFGAEKMSRTNAPAYFKVEKVLRPFFSRKDLSKFLGLDDSDGEEIVFIQTKPPQNYRRLNNNNNNINNNNHCSSNVNNNNFNIQVSVL
jgi:hypothetical protein